MTVYGPGISNKEESTELITADPIILKYEAKLPKTTIYGHLPTDESLKNHYIIILLSTHNLCISLTYIY